jgi:hypothetical protein
MTSFDTLRFAGRYALVGLAVGVFVAGSANGQGWGLFPVYASAAAFITACVVWRWRVVRRHAQRCLTGLLAGALVGVLSHVLCWWLFILGAFIDFHWFGGDASLREPPMNPLQALFAAVVYSVFSLYLFGWLTIAAGALLGCWMLRKGGR